MGWTEYSATHFDRRGNIDRRAECRDYFRRNANWGTLIKDAMIGSTWYGAVKLVSTGEIFAVVMLTSTTNGTEFAYKDMDETCGPCAYDCPASILNLLSPPTNEWSREWREACRQQIARKAELRKLHKATVIDVVYPFDTSHRKAGDKERLYRVHRSGRRHDWWINAPNKYHADYRVSPRLLQQLQITIVQ